MKTKKINKQGISLIVLIITIIVMIILASAIILTLNNSGIINKANEAVEVTDLAQVKHIATLKWSEAYLDKKTSQAELYDAVVNGLIAEKINPDNYDITVTEAGVDVALKVKVPSKWKENVIAIVDTVPIPKGFVASPYDGEKTKNGGLVIYELNESETAIPSDETQQTSWTTRNQYVWVPVAREDFVTKFVRKKFDSSYETSNTLGAQYWETLLDLTTNMPLQDQNGNYISSDTRSEVQSMYASVKEYQGFYIARYEAGIDTQRTSDNGQLEENVYSIMWKIPYNYIPWTDEDAIYTDVKGAVQKARSIYLPDNTRHGVVSTLTYGVQWDTVLQWLDKNKVTSVTESSDYGNYRSHIIASKDGLNEGAMVWTNIKSDDVYVEKDSDTLTYPKTENGTGWLLSTGALKAAKVNNIYDMAGNLEEWTIEALENYGRVARGGNYSSNSSSANIAYRNELLNPAYSDIDVGFRVSLYIKK